MPQNIIPPQSKIIIFTLQFILLPFNFAIPVPPLLYPITRQPKCSTQVTKPITLVSCIGDANSCVNKTIKITIFRTGLTIQDDCPGIPRFKRINFNKRLVIILNNTNFELAHSVSQTVCRPLTSLLICCSNETVEDKCESGDSMMILLDYHLVLYAQRNESHFEFYFDTINNKNSPSINQNISWNCHQLKICRQLCNNARRLYHERFVCYCSNMFKCLDNDVKVATNEPGKTNLRSIQTDILIPPKNNSLNKQQLSIDLYRKKIRTSASGTIVTDMSSTSIQSETISMSRMKSSAVDSTQPSKPDPITDTSHIHREANPTASLTLANTPNSIISNSLTSADSLHPAAVPPSRTQVTSVESAKQLGRRHDFLPEGPTTTTNKINSSRISTVMVPGAVRILFGILLATCVMLMMTCRRSQYFGNDQVIGFEAVSSLSRTMNDISTMLRLTELSKTISSVSERVRDANGQTKIPVMTIPRKRSSLLKSILIKTSISNLKVAPQVKQKDANSKMESKTIEQKLTVTKSTRSLKSFLGRNPIIYQEPKAAEIPKSNLSDLKTKSQTTKASINCQDSPKRMNPRAYCSDVESDPSMDYIDRLVANLTLNTMAQTSDGKHYQLHQ